MAVYDFGMRLKELREGKRLSQSDVADRLDVTRATISGYECNTITPSVEQLVKLAQPLLKTEYGKYLLDVAEGL